MTGKMVSIYVKIFGILIIFLILQSCRPYKDSPADLPVEKDHSTPIPDELSPPALATPNPIDQTDIPTITALQVTATPSPSPSMTPTEIAGVLIAAGDMVECGIDPPKQTASLVLQLIQENPDAQVITAGDNEYEDGKAVEFRNCFDPSWGQFKARIHPSPGNHEYHTPNASGYFGYFGEAAGDPQKGYYSFELGAWHIISINSNCGYIGGCGPDSDQIHWLQNDLLTHPNRCTLAYWHHPRWSSGAAGSNPGMDTLWKTLFENGADVVVNGHEHSYERFTPLNGRGEVDLENGLREFIVGTGGRAQRQFNRPIEGSEARSTGVFGVLEFHLFQSSYSWEFRPVEGEGNSDRGKGDCH
jgi:hypothetical protein